MKRSAPLQRRTPLRARARISGPTVDREPRPMALTPATRRGSYAGAVAGIPAPKEAPVRSETYRRLVAAMPCWQCRAPAPSQAAHANFGKSLGMKTDDRTCFPMCPQCHAHHDQGGVPREIRRATELQAGRDTRAAIKAAGLWPKNLPEYQETEE